MHGERPGALSQTILTNDILTHFRGFGKHIFTEKGQKMLPFTASPQIAA
jgi:hypothetical protein